VGVTKEMTGDPKDGHQHDAGARFVPVAGSFGTAAVIPGPMTAGPPQPEPEERWTLAPIRRAEPPIPASDDPDPEGVPVEPVRATVKRHATGGGERDRS
jgi:hypothetical protein